jgi:glutamine synthetase
MAKTQLLIVKSISKHLNELNDLVNEMVEARKKANKIKDTRKKAYAYCDEVKIYFDKIRYHADKLELQVDDEMWPLPKLREMLFTK